MRDTPQTLSAITASIRLAEWPTSTPPADRAQSAAEKPAERGAGEPMPETETEKTPQRRMVDEVLKQTPAQQRTAAARAARGSTEDPDSLQDRMTLVRTIGSRMREARELAGLSQQEAAMLMEYKNSSKLAKIELASDTTSVPLGAILKASRIFEVSIDFIFGETDDWERDPRIARERAVGKWLFDWLEKTRTRDAAAFTELARRVETATAQISRLADGAEQSRMAFDRFRDMNPMFEDLIGGARLEACIARLEEDGRKARAALRRLHLDLQVERADAPESACREAART